MGKYELVEKHLHSPDEVLADLVGAELHEQCVRFPPPADQVAWQDEAMARRFRAALPSLPAPDSPLIALLCQVLDLEIDHELDALERLLEGGALAAACPTAAHRETFHFLWRLLLNHLEERALAMQVPFKRREKHRVVDSLRKRSLLVQLS